MVNNDQTLQRDTLTDLKSQASSIPSMEDKYRCMVVWDTRTNKDVGWVMVRKKGVEDLNVEEVEKKMSLCQWRTWNVIKKNFHTESDEPSISSGVNTVVVPEEIQKESNVSDVIVKKNSEEASTSKESKKGYFSDAAGKQMLEQAVNVDAAIQVEEDARSMLMDTIPEDASENIFLGKMATIENVVLDKLEVMNIVSNNNSDDLTSVTKVKTKASKRKAEKRHNVNKIVKDTCRAVKIVRDEFRDCPDCKKKVKQRNFSAHVKSAHPSKHVLTQCNVCKVTVLERNLLLHRKTLHPERFMSDLITCSGCQKHIRAVDFDSHECEDDWDWDEPFMGDNNEHKCAKIFKMSTNLSILSKILPIEKRIENVGLSSREIKVSVKIKRLRLDHKGEIDSREECFMCEECGEVFHSGEALGNHGCSNTGTDGMLGKDATSKNIPTNDTEVNLISAKIIEQPPTMLQRGKCFIFSLQLIGRESSCLQIQSACLAACSGENGLQYRLQLLQADGSTTLQSLWVGCVCITTQGGQHAVLQNCLVSSKFGCRQESKDILQLCISCEKHCDTMDCRFKLVVGTKQTVLCYTREMFVHNNKETVKDFKEKMKKNVFKTGPQHVGKKKVTPTSVGRKIECRKDRESGSRF